VQTGFRLTRSEDFKRVRQSGKSYAHPLMVLIVQANDEVKLRVGVTAGRGVGTAVKRNQAKRLMREAMRPLPPSIVPGWDLVLIARPLISSATLSDTRQALLTLLQRAGLFSLNDAV